MTPAIVAKRARPAPGVRDAVAVDPAASDAVLADRATAASVASYFFLDFACLVSPGLGTSPITVLSGHTENTGHFLHPATTAIGHKVMIDPFTEHFSIRHSAHHPGRGKALFAAGRTIRP